jgi:hypothetical protein
MPITVGFIIRDFLQDYAGDYGLDGTLWRSLVDNILEKYKDDHLVEMGMTVENSSGDLFFRGCRGTPLPLDAGRFYSFSMFDGEVSFGYVRDVANIAEKYFGDRVRRWSLVQNVAHGHLTGSIAGPGPDATENRLDHLHDEGWPPFDWL